jgi:hypothetical protein
MREKSVLSIDFMWQPKFVPFGGYALSEMCAIRHIMIMAFQIGFHKKTEYC